MVGDQGPVLAGRIYWGGILENSIQISYLSSRISDRIETPIVWVTIGALEFNSHFHLAMLLLACE